MSVLQSHEKTFAYIGLVYSVLGFIAYLVFMFTRPVDEQEVEKVDHSADRGSLRERIFSQKRLCMERVCTQGRM